ncbi:hypothetical protein R83H12_02189 [Fibrobacteria bacterium R8-3-H12]
MCCCVGLRNYPHKNKNKNQKIEHFCRFSGHIVLIGLVATSALIEAGKERLRPILMTTFAMIFGMMPIAIASGDGAEIKNGMAWVIIGGLNRATPRLRKPIFVSSMPPYG